MVTVDGIKMGKSLGNFRTCEDLLARHSPEALRAFVLSTHYRSPSNYTEEAITAAASGLTRLTQLQTALLEIVEKNVSAGASDNEAEKLSGEVDEKIRERLDDDIDSPGAIATLYSFVTEVNRFIGASALSARVAALILAVVQKWGGDVLGILPAISGKESDVDIAPIMQMLIELRQEMKAAKKFDVADAIRNRLKDAGVLIEDTRDGARWKRI
ncbi:MAG TPA: hypothetical protein DCG57_02140 [Candidatus Riflebacteria bacterium]|nr:hypothetical protein [Candidatus Riflebacteria bacterium]